ncbi:MAG: efflux RND transporter permease subunit, partial [Microcoleaceae cyanobacterium]
VGELFLDIGLGLSITALLSLFAAVTLVPMLAGLFLNQNEAQQMLAGMGSAGNGRGTTDKPEKPLTRPSRSNAISQAVFKTSAIFRLWQGKLEQFLLSTVRWSLGEGRIGRRLILLAIPLGLLVVSILLLPPADYLPEGNRNLVRWLAEPFPGTSIPEAVALSEQPRLFASQQPNVIRTLYVHRGGFRVVAVFLDPNQSTTKNLDNLVDKLQSVSGNFPGYRFLVPRRASIFQYSGKEFEIQLVGQDLEQLDQIHQKLMGQLRELPGIQSVRPNFVNGAPELQVIPKRERLAELGLSEAEIGRAVEAALGGLRASKFVDGKRELDVTVELKNTFVDTPEELRQLALSVGNGRQVQLTDVADVVETTGPDAINHVDLERSITLTAGLERTASLGATLKLAQEQVLDPLRQTLPPGFRLELAGSADILAETLSQLVATFALSLIIIYLLLTALYRSFRYPLIIMITVPMGITGAVLSLVLANSIPGVNIPLDMMTGLGFVILTGIVVNNAILLLDWALQLRQDRELSWDDALYQAVSDRLRPIFMTAGTSVLGMLPLAIIPGKGAELYQGLGIVLVGGLALSTLLTPTVVPALVRLMEDWEEIRRSKVRIQPSASDNAVKKHGIQKPEVPEVGETEILEAKRKIGSRK